MRTPPLIAVAARKPKASTRLFATRASRGAGGDFGGRQSGSEPLLLAVIARALPEARAADAGRAVTPDDLAVGVFAEQVVDEDVLGDDGVAFHPHHLGNVGDPA